MVDTVSPVVRSRRLAAALRRLRLTSGLTIEEVAVQMECSTAKLSRIENALVTVRVQDARELLDLYGVHGSEREDLLELVRQAKGRAWWHAYADLMADGFHRVVGFEAEASTIRMLEARLIPGLLQTEQYTTALMSLRSDLPPATVDRLVQLRMERQRVLRCADPASLLLVLDEAALRRRVGPASLMRDQYRRLIDEARSPTVGLRVLPLDAEPYQAPGFSFTIFGFADPADPEVVFEEMLEGTGFHEDVDAVGRYRLAFEHAWSRALDAAASQDLLAEMAERLR